MKKTRHVLLLAVLIVLLSGLVGVQATAYSDHYCPDGFETYYGLYAAEDGTEMHGEFCMECDELIASHAPGEASDCFWCSCTHSQKRVNEEEGSDGRVYHRVTCTECGKKMSSHLAGTGGNECEECACKHTEVIFESDVDADGNVIHKEMCQICNEELTRHAPGESTECVPVPMMVRIMSVSLRRIGTSNM